MSKKHLVAIMLLLSATLAAPGAIADINETATSTREAGRSGATYGDTEEEATRRLIEQFRAAHLSLSSGDGNRRTIASQIADRDDRLRDIELARVQGKNSEEQ